MRVITLGSGKGGTGKSFLAVNLALALSRGGVRTCLVDLDFGSADLHLLLGRLQPRRGVLEFLQGEVPSLVDVMHPVDPGRLLFLVPGAGETVRAAGLSTREIENLVRGVGQLPVEAVIVDLPAGAAHQVLDLFLAGDAQLVVTTPDVVAVNDAARFLRLARMRHAAHGSGAASAPRSPRVYTSLDELVRDMNAIRSAEENDTGPVGFNPGLVLNRCRAAVGHSRDDLIARLQQEVGDGVDLALEAEIPEDEAVDRSMRLLAPLVELAPAAPASQAIVAFASRLNPRASAESWREGAEALEPAGL